MIIIIILVHNQLHFCIIVATHKTMILVIEYYKHLFHFVKDLRRRATLYRGRPAGIRHQQQPLD